MDDCESPKHKNRNARSRAHIAIGFEDALAVFLNEELLGPGAYVPLCLTEQAVVLEGLA